MIRGAEKRYGRGIVSQFQRTNGVGGSGGGFTTSSQRDVIDISVATTDWLDDDGSGGSVTPTYTDAPVHGTIKYADIRHSLSSGTAHAVSYHDIVTRRTVVGGFVDQVWIDNNTLRVWLMGTPANDVSIKVTR